MERSLTSIDKFGFPVNLTYRKEQTFKSSFGGVMTILSILSLMIYFLVMLMNVINNEKYVLTRIDYLRDLFFDIRTFNFTYNQFDVAY